MRALAAALFLMILGPMSALAGEFEGVVHFKDTRSTMKGDRAMEFDYFLKGSKARLEMPGQSGVGGAMLFDAETQKTFILMPERSMYMELQLQDLPAVKGESANAAGSVSVVKTGKQETLLGYGCEVLAIKSEHGESDVCVTKELGSFFTQRMGPPGMGRSAMKGGTEGDYAWAKEFRDKGYFPLRAITKDASGREVNRLEATSIQKKSLAASTFTVPEGYTKFDMAQMLKGLGLSGDKQGLPPGLSGGLGGRGRMPPGVQIPVGPAETDK